MRTELQRQTARLNGAKSRGPLTAAGKRRSSQNACRHGLYSRRIVSEFVPDLPAPLPTPAFATPAEAMFHLAYLEYMRIACLETRILGEEIERQRTLHPAASGRTLLARAWRHHSEETGVVEALYRLQCACSRRLAEALDQLALEDKLCETNPAISLKSEALSPDLPNPNVAGGQNLGTQGLSSAHISGQTNPAGAHLPRSHQGSGLTSSFHPASRSQRRPPQNSLQNGVTAEHPFRALVFIRAVPHSSDGRNARGFRCGWPRRRRREHLDCKDRNPL